MTSAFETLLVHQKEFLLQIRQQSEEVARQRLIELHRRKRRDIQAAQKEREDVAPDAETYGNHPGTPLENIRLPGPAVTEFDYRREIVAATLRMLKAGGPRNKGEYADGSGHMRAVKPNANPYSESHVIVYNGRIVASLPVKLQQNDEIIIVNTKPYARRLEVGKRENGTYFTIKETDAHHYENTAKKIKLIYKDAARVSHTYVTGAFAAERKFKLSERYRAMVGQHFVNRKRNQHIGETIRQPAIRILGRP